MLFSTYLIEHKNRPLQAGVAERLDELQSANELDAVVILTEDVQVTGDFIEYKAYLGEPLVMPFMKTNWERVV